jgi:hypothetical protein
LRSRQDLSHLIHLMALRAGLIFLIGHEQKTSATDKHRWLHGVMPGASLAGDA